MMGLERLMRTLYGTTPQLDMDKKLLRAQVPKPQQLDFEKLADGIKRNNLGVAVIRVIVDAEISGGRVTVKPTGQVFPLEGSPPADGISRRRTFDVLDWLDPAKTRLQPVD